MRLIVVVIAIFLSACGSTYSSLQPDGSSSKAIYEISEDQAFQVAFGSIVQVFPGYDIADVDGPVRGYSTSFRFVLDTYTQQVMVVPATGKGTDGRLVKGYYFDVSGRGSSVIQGRVKNAELFDTVTRAAQATGKLITVSEVRLASYSGSKWKQGEVVQQKRAPEGDAFDQIEKLKKLRDSGAITEEEFAKKRKELLERI